MPNFDYYLESSPRKANYDSELQKLYVAYFARPADPVGLKIWNNMVTSAVAAGLSVDVVFFMVANSFASAPEFQTSFSGLTSDAIVSKIYQNLFSRAPDPEGLIFWSSKLAKGELTPEIIITALVSSATSDPSGADGIAFTSKVTAANLFTNAIDTIDETVGYSGAIANNLAKAFISSVNSPGTLAVETTPENLADTIHNVTTAKVLPPVDFGQKDITQKVDNYANKLEQKLDLGAGLKIHSAVPLTDVPGIKMPNTLKYSIDANGVIQFSGSLEITKAYSDRDKAAIIEKILGDDHSSVVFYKSGADVFAFANNGDASSADHLVKITGIANQFQGGHLNPDGSISADVGQYNSPESIQSPG